MDWTTFVPSIVGAGLGTTIAGAFLGSWLNYRFWLARRRFAEEREKETRRREASKAVAEILGEWVKPFYMGPSSNEDRWKLQAKYWRSILRVDKELVVLLTQVLQNLPDGPGSKDAIVQARKVLHGLPEPDISVAQIIHWDPV